jgi:hypothetical protein
MIGEDISKLFEVPTIKQSMLNLYGPQGALLILLYRLDIVGMRRISLSYAASMMSSLNPPPCSIPMASISLSRDYLQFCPKRMSDEEYRHKR